MEVLEGVEGLDSVEIIDIGAHAMEVSDSDVLCEVELIEASTSPLPLENCEKHYELQAHEAHETQQKREINRKSVGEIKNEKSVKIREITIEMREVEMSINTSTVEEVIFKKHRVEIIDKRSRGCIMQGVITGYTLVGRVYDPDILMEFEDGRSFYNENFGYLMRFYI
jgi:hypothetical protein